MNLPSDIRGLSLEKTFFKTFSIVLSKELYSLIFPYLKSGSNSHFLGWQNWVLGMNLWQFKEMMRKDQFEVSFQTNISSGLKNQFR